MTLKDIAEKTLAFLGVNADMDQTGDEQTFVTGCVKDALMRLTGEIVDVRTKKKVVAENGHIPYSSVDADFKRAFSLKKNGKRFSFTESADGLETEEDGEYEVAYAYFVRPATLTSVVALPPKYSVNVLALGAAGEYCYRKGMYKESEVYDDRFLTAVTALDRVAKDVTVRRGE